MNEMKPSETPYFWMEKARSDLQLGKAALRTPGVLAEDACFHAQQCVEKALKGLLSELEIPFPRTHVLEVLIDLLKAKGVDVPPIVDDSFELTQYAVITRYPGEWEPVTKDETRKALERATIVLKWVEDTIE